MANYNKDGENQGVVLNQPLTFGGAFYSVGFTPPVQYNGPPILSPLLPLTYMALKHDREAECCSSTTHYQLEGRNKEVLLKGISEARQCCQRGPSPMHIQSVEGNSMIEVQIEQPGCCASTMDINISAPPGNQIGSILLERYSLYSTKCELSSNWNGQKLFVDTKIHFLSGPEYFFSDETGRSVAVVKCERTKYRLEVEPDGVDTIMKANLIGFMLLIDFFSQQQAAAAHQST